MKNLFELASFVLITSCVLIAFASPAFARPDPTWIVAESTLLDYGSSTELGSDGAIHGDRVIVSGPFGATVYRGVSGGNLEFEATLRPLLAADNAIYVHTAIQEDMIALGIRYDSDGPDDVLQVYEREGTEWALTYAEVYENYRGYSAEIQGMDGVGNACGSLTESTKNPDTCRSVLDTMKFMLEDRKKPVPAVCKMP